MYFIIILSYGDLCLHTKTVYTAVNPFYPYGSVLFLKKKTIYGTGNGKFYINTAVKCTAVTVIRYGVQPYDRASAKVKFTLLCLVLLYYIWCY